MTLFKFNQLLFLTTNFCFAISWYIIFTFDIYNNPYYTVIFALLNIIFLHYLFTTVHQASHRLLSRSYLLNYFCGFLACLFSGITFADFLYTHTLHHKHIGDKSQDPDNFISDGPVLLIPFKIFYHDYYFLKFNKDPKQLFSYVLQRLLQVSLVYFIFLDKINLFVVFWLIPMLIIGLINALFLFYFPHYIHPLEKQLNNIKIIKQMIEISRDYHHKHHDNPANNYNFFLYKNTNSIQIKEKEYSREAKNYIYKQIAPNLK